MKKIFARLISYFSIEKALGASLESYVEKYEYNFAENEFFNKQNEE